MYVTSFSSISYRSNGEYWTQKRTQSESIHSVILDVYVLKAEPVMAQFQIEAPDPYTPHKWRTDLGMLVVLSAPDSVTCMCVFIEIS